MLNVTSLILLLLITLLSSLPFSSLSSSILTPISKDPHTSLYTITLNNHIFLLDLAGPLLASHCGRRHPTIPCNSTTCALANSLYSPPNCPKPSSDSNPNPNSPTCSCTTSLTNPITYSCAPSHLTLTTFTLSPQTSLISSCTPKSILQSLPTSCSGLAGFSRSPLSLPSQLAFSLAFNPQFSLCLPSSALFGEFTKKPSPSMAYTPLLKNPVTSYSDRYYVRVSDITVNGMSVPFLSRVLEFDSLGHGGVHLSSIVPYTKMRTHIYHPFLQAFSAATKGIPRAPRVAPFDLCLKPRSTVANSLPRVDFMMPGGKNWTIWAGSSMKPVGGGVVCLGFVNGGWRMEEAMVIGGFQMEERVMVFDQGRSKLGFSDSFLTTGASSSATCANYFG